MEPYPLASPRAYTAASRSTISIQIFYDYIHNHEMMKVKASPQSRQAIEAASI